MTLQEVSRSLRSRLRSRALWGAFSYVFLAYACFLVWHWPRRVPVEPPGVLYSQVATAFLFYFCFIWISPLPWQWDGRPGAPSTSFRTVFQAFLWGETVSTILVFIDATARRHAGATQSFLITYVFQACYQGPALSLVGYMVAQRERTESEKAEMRSQVTEAQSLHLRGQLHPHVLFNALNGLAELVHEDTEVAESHIRSMSALLRQILDASEADTYPLREERLLVERYLQLEAIRLGQRMRVDWQWPEELDEVPTPPLLLQPLVENAVKHGLSPVRGGGELSISAAWEGKELVLAVRNTGKPLPTEFIQGSGIGLRNLHKRLELAYRDQAVLRLWQEGPWAVAEIRMNPLGLDPDYAETPNHRR